MLAFLLLNRTLLCKICVLHRPHVKYIMEELSCVDTGSGAGTERNARQRIVQQPLGVARHRSGVNTALTGCCLCHRLNEELLRPCYMRVKHCDERVCMSVRSRISKNARPDFTKCSACHTCSLSPLLCHPLTAMQCTSSLVDDVMFCP